MDNIEWEKALCQAFEKAINQGSIVEANQLAAQLMQYDVRIQVDLDLTSPPPIPIIPPTQSIPNYNQRPAQNQAPRGPPYPNANNQQRSLNSIDKIRLKEELENMGYSPINAQIAAKKFDNIEDAVNYLSTRH